MRRTIEDLTAEAWASLPRLEPREAAAAVERGKLLVDIRPGSELAADGVIPGALHVERTKLEWRVDPASGHQHPALAGRENDVVLICTHGYSSALAAVTLRGLGFDVTDVAGGFVAWAAAGLPVEPLEA